MWPDGNFKPSDIGVQPKVPDPSPLTSITQNGSKVFNKTEMANLVPSQNKSRDNSEYSSAAPNGSTMPLVSEKKLDDDDSVYDPFTHRDVPHPMSDADTLVHLLKGCLGSGILAMPMAFANAGLIFGIFATLMVGIICTYCVHMLVASAHVLYRKMKISHLDYSGVAEAAFMVGPERLKKYRKLAKAFVDTFLMVDLYGCCCVYVVFVARSIKQVVEHYVDSTFDVRVYIACLLIPLIVVNLIHNLKFLAPFSMIANICMAIGIGITFYYIFSALPPVYNRDYLASYQQMPLFFGTAIFALEGIGVVMPLENNMKKPQHFLGCPGVLFIGMSVVVIMYTTVGFFGYLRYGDETEAAITLNLPKDSLLAQSVKIMIALAIFLTYSLQFYVPMGIAWKSIKPLFPKNPVVGEYIVRIFLIVMSVVIAAAVPNLGPFISLVGAVCLSFLGLIFPAIIETVTLWDKPGLAQFRWRLAKNIFIILFGVLGFFTGTVSSMKEISETFV